jgi:hypothetical protein
VPRLGGARRASVIWPQSRGIEISTPMETCAGVGTRPEPALLEFASRQPAIIIVCHQNRYMYQNKYIYWSSTGCQQISVTPAFAFCLTQNHLLNQGEGGWARELVSTAMGSLANLFGPKLLRGVGNTPFRTKSDASLRFGHTCLESRAGAG